MPWVKKTLCNGCGICTEECPVGAIELSAPATATINEEKCVRCGHCHEVCPEHAVRHDGERIPQDVADNLRWVRALLAHYKGHEEQAAFIRRIIRFFKKQKSVSEQTLLAIENAQARPQEELDAAIRQLSELAHAETKMRPDRPVGKTS